jgi:hypothetical protein
MDAMQSAGNDHGLSPESVSRVRAALVAAASQGNRRLLDAPLRTLGEEARGEYVAPEQIVLMLRRVWRTTTRPGLVGALDWERLYRYGVDTLLAMYFEQRA